MICFCSLLIVSSRVSIFSGIQVIINDLYYSMKNKIHHLYSFNNIKKTQISQRNFT